jgi:hypothetical protein
MTTIAAPIDAPIAAPISAPAIMTNGGNSKDASTGVGGTGGGSANWRYSANSGSANSAKRNESVIFMFIPNGKARGCVIRLDPHGSNENDYTQSTESCVGDMMASALNTTVTGTLGMYNRALKVADPATGAPLHIIGFEGGITDSSLQWNHTHYYGGGMYTIRDGQQRYKWQEINGRWSKASGKRPLIAPRTFCLSPFAEEQKQQVVYVAGFDTNFNLATNHAWIFKAPLANVLGGKL